MGSVSCAGVVVRGCECVCVVEFVRGCRCLSVLVSVFVLVRFVVRVVFRYTVIRCAVRLLCNGRLCVCMC